MYFIDKKSLFIEVFSRILKIYFMCIQISVVFVGVWAIWNAIVPDGILSTLVIFSFALIFNPIASLKLLVEICWRLSSNLPDSWRTRVVKGLAHIQSWERSRQARLDATFNLERESENLDREREFMARLGRTLFVLTFGVVGASFGAMCSWMVVEATLWPHLDTITRMPEKAILCTIGGVIFGIWQYARVALRIERGLETKRR
ncbi:MAG: hypothetical protein JNK11_08275 [Alphaproteobacteria bacterium]|nr:hypothetical protein [Alphaproteobacteria bacterium]